MIYTDRIYKILIPLAFFYFSGLFANAQTVLLEQNLKADTIKKNFGQNLKHYYHTYIDFGFVSGVEEADSVHINYGLSNSFTFGFRYKRKISKNISAGYNVAFSTLGYSIKQDAQKRFVDDTIHKKEKLFLTNFSIEFYARIGLGKRGNIIGKYLDLGIYGNWILVSRLNLKDTEKIRDKEILADKNIRKLPFTEPLSYGVCARIGINRFAFSASYRISNLFKKAYHFEELPRLILGIQVGLY